MCPGLESNQHVLANTAPSRRRVYQFRHLGPDPCSGLEGLTRIMWALRRYSVPDPIVQLYCEPARVRTGDLLIKSQMLYQLSYGIMPFYRRRENYEKSVVDSNLISVCFR